MNISKVKRIYNKFKLLRETIGKPVDNTINPKKIRKDLSINDFISK